MSSTMRLFINDNRISTAVPVRGGILQVYPTKRNFASDVEWKQFWENELKPKITLKVGEVESVTVKPVPAPAPAPVPAPAPAVHVKPVKQKKAKISDWIIETRKRGFVFSIPSGTYYIGDLCYVLGDDVYDTIYGGNNYSPGIYIENTSGKYLGQGLGDNRFFLVDNTAYGDGEYPGSDGKKFAVDAGIIGICPASLMTKNDGGGHMYTFKLPVMCRFEDGRFFFNSGYQSLVIDTTGDDEGF